MIKGWDEGVATMTRGELARFIIKPSYGYGAKGSPPTIPGAATLIFEIELFDFEGEDLSENQDKSIVRRIITKGTAYTTPNDCSRCVVNLRGIHADGKPFDVRENLEFEIGEGVHKNIIEGVEYALTKFKKEEHSILYINSKRAWGAAGCPAFNVAADEDVVYEVELKEFEKAKESWQLNWSEKLKQSELLKNKGTELFKVISLETKLLFFL